MTTSVETFLVFERRINKRFGRSVSPLMQCLSELTEEERSNLDKGVHLSEGRISDLCRQFHVLPKDLNDYITICLKTATPYGGINLQYD